MRRETSEIHEPWDLAALDDEGDAEDGDDDDAR